MVKMPALLCLVLLIPGLGKGQKNCVQHWSRNEEYAPTMDSVLASVDIQHIDTLFCDSTTQKTALNAKWYINFYNKHFGIYFSNARSVSFAMFHFREKYDSITNEIHIIEFRLAPKQVMAFKKRYGSVSKRKATYSIEAFCAYKYVAKEDRIYYVSTETFSLALKNNSFFEDIVDQIYKPAHSIPSSR